MRIKVIACEIMVRELYQAAARAQNLVDLEFLTQGYHDTPRVGCVEIQKRIDAVPPGRYDAIGLGYGLCSSILTGLTTPHTPLVIPRVHDCIACFLGSHARYQQLFDEYPGTFYYTSGWIECGQRRAESGPGSAGTFMPAHSQAGVSAQYSEWVEKYGEDQARYLMSVLDQWTAYYNRGVLIEFDFTAALNLPAQVKEICAERNWTYAAVAGDLGLLERLLDGPWAAEEFLVLRPGERVVAAFDSRIIAAEPVESVV